MKNFLGLSHLFGQNSISSKKKKFRSILIIKIIYISERGCFGDGDPGMVDEAGHPLVSIKEAATIVKDYR